MGRKIQTKMIVKSRYGPVGSWGFEDISKQVHVHDRESLDERIIRSQEVALILEKHELLHANKVTLFGWVVRDPPNAPEPPTTVSINGASEIGDRCNLVLDDLEQKRGFRDFTNLMVTGTGTALDEQSRPREVSDLVWLDAYTIQFHCIQVITQSDIWLPFTLRGAPQAELAALNAPRLERALRSLCSGTKLNFSFEEISPFALNYGFRLDNRKNREGGPIDVIDDPHMLEE
jgi:hypothetical protein